MAADLPPWEPPLAGTEIEHLLGALDRMRATFRWKADGLDANGMAARLPSSQLSVGGLLKHLARVEDEASSVRLDGSPRDARWDGDAPDDDPEFRTAAEDEPEVLYAWYDEAVIRARRRFEAAIAERGLDAETPMRGPGGQLATIRRLLFDLLEEYGRHTGHADLLREAIDGRVGEDPPANWSPFRSGD
ncbi:MAG: DUF664 domain-containing protein [Actinomycetota bacterium]